MRKNLDLSLYQSTSASTYSHVLVDDDGLVEEHWLDINGSHTSFIPACDITHV